MIVYSCIVKCCWIYNKITLFFKIWTILAINANKYKWLPSTYASCNKIPQHVKMIASFGRNKSHVGVLSA